MASFLFIYGTTGGNTEMVVDRVAGLILKAGHAALAKRVELCEPADMLTADVCVLASPTYGHGILQDHMIPFHQALSAFDLKGHPCAVIGLGDPKYDAQYHLESAAILEEAIKSSGGTLILPALRVSGTPVRFLDTIVPRWTEELLKKATS